MILTRLKNRLNRDQVGEEVTPAAPENAILFNAYCTRNDVPPIQFPHTLNSLRDLSDPELEAHLNGFIGYVMSRGDGKMSRARYHVMRHIERVQQQWSFYAGEDQLDAVSNWAARANALIFLPDGHVRDDQGRILVSSTDGGSEAAAAVPYPELAWRRKERSEALLTQRAVRIMPSLPPVVSEPELRLREPGEVAQRALAVLIAAVRAEGMNSGDPMSPQQLQELLPLGFAALTPEESAFVSQNEPEQEDLAKFGWRYECAFVFAWALGLTDTLPWPADICDAGVTVALFLHTDPDSLRTESRLRDSGEILDALDLHYRLHWALAEARLGRGEAPADTDSGVVLERHRALNWLIRFANSDWDSVDTPT